MGHQNSFGKDSTHLWNISGVMINILSKDIPLIGALMMEVERAV